MDMVLQPSLAAMARQQERQRTCPPPVPPLLTQSHFDSVEAYKDYMRTRRKAQERLREFNRPARKRRAAVKQPTAASLESSRRPCRPYACVSDGCSWESMWKQVGRKRQWDWLSGMQPKPIEQLVDAIREISTRSINVEQARFQLSHPQRRCTRRWCKLKSGQASQCHRCDEL